MARPKKIDSDDLVAIVESFFREEVAGNPTKLKCSLLEKYAIKLGKSVKAYDFRRDTKVRQRIAELKELVRHEAGIGIQFGNPYKNLDIVRIMQVRQNPDELRTVLGELDAYWQYIYENTLQIRRNAESDLKEKRELKEKNELLLQEKDLLQKNLTASKSEIRELIIENRYLKRMLRTYLYPAIANDILADEKQLTNPDTEVTAQVKETLIDGELPSATSSAFSEDIKLLSEEEKLLKQMWESISENRS